MRRKVLQDFANTLCQRFLDLPEGFDLAVFAHHGSGTYHANLLSGACTHDGEPIRSLRLCGVYKEWLMRQCTQHHIAFDAIDSIDLKVTVAVGNATTLLSFGHRFASAHFAIDCRSEIGTDEKVYVGKSVGEREWGFDWYYEKLYGAIPDSWPHLSH